MIVYNVTIKITNAIHTDWLQWLQEEHIPDIIQTGCFTHALILKLMEVDDTEGPTYAVQYFAESKGLYNNYIENHAAGMTLHSMADMPQLRRKPRLCNIGNLVLLSRFE